jgi:hypothetical protein
MLRSGDAKDRSKGMTIPITDRELGRRAFIAGVELRANPFKVGTEPHESWAAGWSAEKWAAGKLAAVEIGLANRPKSQAKELYTDGGPSSVDNSRKQA